MTAAPRALAKFVFFHGRIPGVFLQLLHAQRNAPLLGIDLEHSGFDLLAHREHVCGFVDAAPGDFAYVQQTVHAAQIDEGAVVGEAADRAAYGFALANLRVATLLYASLFFFGERAPIDHYIFFGGIELDDAAADFLPHQLFHFGGIAHAAARGRHECADSNIHAESALDHARDRAYNRRFLGEGLLQRRPIRGLRNLLAGKFVVAFRIAALDRDRHLVARLHRLRPEIAASGMMPSVLKPISKKTDSAETAITVASSCFPPSSFLREWLFSYWEKMSSNDSLESATGIADSPGRLGST